MTRPKSPPRSLSPPRILPIADRQSSGSIDVPIPQRPRLTVNEKAGSEIVYGNVTLERARIAIVATLHFTLSLVSHQLKSIEEGDFAVSASLDKAEKRACVVLASYGTMDVVDRDVPWDRSICHMNSGFMTIANTGLDKRTCDMPWVSSAIKSYVGQRIGRLSLSIVTTRAIAQDHLDRFASSFKEVSQVLESLLVDSNELLLAENAARLAERERAEARHLKKLREIENNTNRFLQHEIKNSLYGSLADVDALRRAVINKSVDHAALVNGLYGLQRDLDNTLETLVSARHIAEIVAGTYKPRLEQVDIGSICSTLTVPVPNKVNVHPSTFVVRTDKTLFRTIATNAVSNAVKYGDPAHPLNIVFERRESDDTEREDRGVSSTSAPSPTDGSSSSVVRVQITNAAGRAQACLASLPDPNVIFRQGWSLRDMPGFDDDGEDASDDNDNDVDCCRRERSKSELTLDSSDNVSDCDGGENSRQYPLYGGMSRLSAGDGAWIMQRSAAALNGKCSISFEETLTTFVLEFPTVTRRADSEMSESTTEPASISPPRLCSSYYDDYNDGEEDSSSSFSPESALFVCLDDEKSHRYHLSVLFRSIGAPHCIYGEDPDTADTFVESARALVAENRDVNVVFFLDNILRFERPDGSSVITSGITLGQQLRERLAEDGNEHRTLILSRTADDTSETVRRCRQLLHDHFPKAPMRDSEFCQALEKRWNRRFGHSDVAERRNE